MSNKDREYGQMMSSRGDSSGNSMYKKYGIMALVVLVLCGVSFGAGMQVQKGKQGSSTTAASSDSQAATLGVGNGGSGGFNGGPPGGGRMNIVFGQVTEISSTSISVQDSRSSSTTTLEITSDTTVTDNGQAASLGSIKVGDDVVVRPNSSNSKQVDQILVNPQVPSGAPGSSPTTN